MLLLLLLLLLLLDGSMRSQRHARLGLNRTTGPMGTRSRSSTDWWRLKNFFLLPKKYGKMYHQKTVNIVGDIRNENSMNR